MTLADIIELYSDIRVGSAATDDITDTQLATLKTNAEARLNIILSGRTFTTSAYEELTAYMVLHILKLRPGKGVIVSESVTDSSWKSSISTSSAWMDEIYSRIAEYDSNVGTVTDLSEEADIDGVLRDDHYIPGLSEGHPVRLPHRRY